MTFNSCVSCVKCSKGIHCIQSVCTSVEKNIPSFLPWRVETDLDTHKIPGNTRYPNPLVPKDGDDQAALVGGTATATRLT